MRYLRQIIYHRFNRFLIVGAGNTAISFAVLNVLTAEFHINPILAAIIATSCAILFSYTMNAKFVFGHSLRQLRKFITFSLVAASGTLLVQTVVYSICLTLLHHVGRTRSNTITINLANLIASVSVTFWNYNAYRLFVFTAKPIISEDYES